MGSFPSELSSFHSLNRITAASCLVSFPSGLSLPPLERRAKVQAPAPELEREREPVTGLEQGLETGQAPVW